MSLSAQTEWRIAPTPLRMASGYWLWKWRGRPGSPAAWFRSTAVPRARAGGRLHIRSLVFRRTVDVLHIERGWRVPHLAAALPWRRTGTDHLRALRRGRHRRGPGRPLADHGRGPAAT